MKNRLLRGTTALVLILAISSMLPADVSSPVFLRQFRADDAAPGDDFGRAVALDGRLGIIGAPSHQSAGFDSGAAYLFDVISGQQLHKLVPNDGAVEDLFGTSVAVDGGYAIVGAHLDDDLGRSSGSAYVFDVHTGRQLHKLLPEDGSPEAEFGVSVDIQDGLIAVGAHKDGPGSVYLFEASSGQQLRKLLSDDGAPDDRFGVAVALDQGKALVGARYDDDQAIASGAAYVFDTTTGEQLKKVQQHDGERGDRHGQHLDLTGSRAVVASRFDDDVRKSSGSAYIYDVDTGQELFKIVADDADPNDHFGSAISTSGALALVGAANDQDLGNLAGSAYLFDVNTGRQLYKIMAEDGLPLDQFGTSVAIEGDVLVIGAPELNYRDAVGLASGKAYVYLIPEPSSSMLAIMGGMMMGCMLSRSARDGQAERSAMG